MKSIIPTLFVVMIALSGCFTSSVIEQASNPKLISHSLYEYESAHLDGDKLVINGYAGRQYLRPTKEYSAIYQIDTKSGLPSRYPISVELHHTLGTLESQKVKLHYIRIPPESIAKSADPETYQGIVIETTEPALYINTFTSEDFSDAELFPKVNHHHILYVPSGNEKERQCALITLAQHRQSRSSHANLLKLPGAAAVDIVTLPVQIIINQELNNIN